jgi:hypothetical protein
MMGHNIRVNERFNHCVDRRRGMVDLLEPYGNFSFDHLRLVKPKSGKYEKINSLYFPNAATNIGRQTMLGCMFLGTSQTANWYFGLIDGAGTPAVAVGDTMASHAGWTEFEDYNEGTRQTWVKAANNPSNQIITSTNASFTIVAVAPGTLVAGAFLVNENTKGGSSGILWSHGLFDDAVPVQETDIFRTNYFVGLNLPS